ARAGECLNVFLRRLGVTLVAKRQGGVEKLFAGARAKVDELRDGKFFQGRLRFAHTREVFAHDAGVDLADVCKRFAGAKIFYLDCFETFIRAPASQRGNVRNVLHATPEVSLLSKRRASTFPWRRSCF